MTSWHWGGNSERAMSERAARHDGKQTDRHRAHNHKTSSRRRLPRPGGRGIKSSKQIEKSRGEGAGRKEKNDERTREHEHLITRPPHIKQASHHTPAAASHPPHIQGTSTTPSRRHRITKQAAAPVVSHRSRSRPRRHPIRSSRAEGTTEA